MTTGEERESIHQKLDRVLSILNNEALTVEGATKMDAGEVVRALLEQDPSLTRDDLIDRIPMGCYWEWFDADAMFKIRGSVSNLRTHHLKQLEG